MSDVRIEFDAEAFRMDVVVEANDLATEGGLETAIRVSLFSDRGAEDGDVLPAGATDRRGWWGDALAEQPGDKIGSRLWLLDRSKKTPDVLDDAEQYAREALQWLLDDLVVASLSVVPSFLTDVDGYRLDISVTRPTGAVANYRFDRVWEGI